MLWNGTCLYAGTNDTLKLWFAEQICILRSGFAQGWILQWTQTAAPKAKHVYMWIWNQWRRGSVSAHRLELLQSFLAPARWTPIPPSAPLQMLCDLQLTAEAVVQIVRPLCWPHSATISRRNITAAEGQVVTGCTWLPKSTLKSCTLSWSSLAAWVALPVPRAETSVSDSTLLIRGRHRFSELLEKFRGAVWGSGNFLHSQTVNTIPV